MKEKQLIWRREFHVKVSSELNSEGVEDESRKQEVESKTFLGKEHGL